MFNLRMDPYERADVTSNTYWDWVLRRAFLATPMQQRVAAFLATFTEYPPAQRAASFSIDQITEKLQRSIDILSAHAGK
jgi:arylsulfatase